MISDDYAFEGPAEAPAAARDNNPPLSISELSFALKRTLEDRFGHVRLRGEISKVSRHASGHVYLTLKDDKAAIDGVIWKGVVRGWAPSRKAGWKSSSPARSPPTRRGPPIRSSSRAWSRRARAPCWPSWNG